MSTDTPRWHHQPRVELRVAQPYVGITARASTEREFRTAVDRDMPALFRWLEAHGLAPAGPPFLRYLVVDEDAVPEEGPPPATFVSGVPLSSRPSRLVSHPSAPGTSVAGRAPWGIGSPGPTTTDGPTAGGEVHTGELPAGTWLVTLHRGGYSGLARVHDLVHDWAAEERAIVDRRPAADGTAFGGAVEHFRVGPFDQPDPWRWETDVAYLLVDDSTREP